MRTISRVLSVVAALTSAPLVASAWDRGILSSDRKIAYLPVLMVCQGRTTPTAVVAPPSFKPITLRLPEYPAIARRSQWEGSGIIEIHLDADGRVFDALTTPRSGHDVLDLAVIGVLREVLFPRGWPDHFRLPYVFTLKPCNSLPVIKHRP